MISITVLSLAPEAVQRLIAHTGHDDTLGRRHERIAACVIIMAASSAAVLVALLGLGT